MIVKFAVICFAAWQILVGDANANPLGQLRTQEPTLYKLYADNKQYSDALKDYARQQGFRNPYENLGTVIHEMIHITSALHQGFFIQGIYYEPYLRNSAWPSLRNRDIAPFLYPGEQSVISAVYLPSTPNNSLGNILDEINAYSQVASFICQNEPQSSKKQATNLSGHLSLLGAYLRAARLRFPAEYQNVLVSRESAGAVDTLYNNAVKALAACGVSAPKSSNAEILYFLDQHRKRLQH